MIDLCPLRMVDGEWRMARSKPPSSILYPPSSVVVIGYGNALRGDDAVGLHVAAAVDEWELPDVRVLVVHQLTPELAEPLAAADVAIFVDAYHAVEAKGVVHVRTIQPAATQPSQTHAGNPGALLAFAETIYGHAPRAWWITVPAQDFAFGSDLSPLTRQGQAIALHWIRHLLRRLRSEQCTRLD